MLHEPSDARPEPLRLFFAVWPGDEVRASLERQLGGLRSRVRATWVQPENLHLTLCFLGAVPRIRLDSLITLNFERHLAFELCFDRLRFLRRRRMLWLEPSRPNPVLMDLVKSLGEQLDQLGQTRDQRLFHAHLSLARNLRGDFSAGEPSERVSWRVGGFDLVASELDGHGACYRRLRHWSLQTTPTGTSVE